MFEVRPDSNRRNKCRNHVHNLHFRVNSQSDECKLPPTDTTPELRMLYWVLKLGNTRE